jgi:transcriptional regulator with XRE-family HTH domain
MNIVRTADELEAELGQQVRALRLRANLDQQTLAQQAGVALSALKNVESGKGATLKTLLKVLRALNRLEWIQSLSPAVSISPLQLLKQKRPRQRASSRTNTASKKPTGA